MPDAIGRSTNHLSHTGCTVARLVLMEYPSPLAKTDPQCKSRAFSHIQLGF